MSRADFDKLWAERNKPPDAGRMLREGVRHVRRSWLQRIVHLNVICWQQRTHTRKLYSQWMWERYMWRVAVLSWRPASWSTMGGTELRYNFHYALTIVQVGPWRVSLM